MKEWELQKAIVTFVRLQYPDKFLLTVQSEGKRTPKNAAIAKAMGLTPGIPDLIFAESVGEYKGLAIELKVGTNKLSAVQKNFMYRLRDKGWMVYEIHDLNSAIETINFYFKKTATIKKPSEQTALFPI